MFLFGLLNCTKKIFVTICVVKNLFKMSSPMRILNPAELICNPVPVNILSYINKAYKTGNNMRKKFGQWVILLVGPINILYWWISLLSLNETFQLWTIWDILSIKELNKQGVRVCSSEISELMRPWHNVSKSCSIRRENGVLDDHTQCMYAIFKLMIHLFGLLSTKGKPNRSVFLSFVETLVLKLLLEVSYKKTYIHILIINHFFF